MTKRLVVAFGLALALAACNDQNAGSTRHLSPIPPSTMSLMAAKGMSKSDPILIRAYKKESELEVWKKGSDGKYALLKSYPICRWSGQLGPKRKEGDRQAPEGFYTVTPAQMNPNSAYYLSFDTGYPNAYDRAHGGTGSQLMVHGTCSSRGCFAMTDEGIAEVYAVAREAFSGGQRGFQFQSYPFRMTAENLAKFRHDPNMPFWRNLKEGADNFEVSKLEPTVGVCNGRYAFNANGCAPKVETAAAVAEKAQRDDQQVAELVAKGTPAVRVVYEDGGQHQSFREVMTASAGDFSIMSARPARKLGDVSRPDALAMGPREVPLEAPATARSAKTTALAFAPAKDAGAPKGAVTKTASKATASQVTVGKDAKEPQVEVEEASAASATAEARPFYRRVFGSTFGSKADDAKPTETETAAAAGDTSAAPVLSGRKTTGKPVPQAPEKRADISSGRSAPVN